MVVLMMTLPAFPLLGKFQRVKNDKTYVRSASGAASSMKKLSILLTQMIEEIREDEHAHGKTKVKDSAKDIFNRPDDLNFKYYLGCTSHPGVAPGSILTGHEQDVHLPPEHSC